MRFYCLCIFALIAFIGCKKHKHTVTINGTLLQSSSNPVPVSNYVLSFYQAGSSSAPIALASFSASDSFKTDMNGNFNCNFKEGSGIFFIFSTTNNAAITVSGVTSNGIRSIWSGLAARDTNVGNLYLYKLVHSAIIKIVPASDVLVTDTLTLQIATANGLHNKSITGTAIPANTETAIDTVQNVVLPYYSFTSKMYSNGFVIYKNGNFNSFNINGFMQDDAEQTYTVRVF